MTLFPRILDELRKYAAPDDVTVWAGGIIPAADAPKLREMGIRAIFGPGSPTSETIEFLRQMSSEEAAGPPWPSGVDHPAPADRARLAELAKRLLFLVDRLALTRLIVSGRGDRDDARAAMRCLFVKTRPSLRRGVAAAPGCGKSTLTTRLALEYRARGQTVGIVAVDPTSPYTGGAILGDRVRMMELHGDPGVFMRSMATRGVMGGLARSTLDVVLLLDAFGKDVVIIETVGVGQDEGRDRACRRYDAGRPNPEPGRRYPGHQSWHPRNCRHPGGQQGRRRWRRPPGRRSADDAPTRRRAQLADAHSADHATKAQVCAGLVDRIAEHRAYLERSQTWHYRGTYRQCPS